MATAQPSPRLASGYGNGACIQLKCQIVIHQVKRLLIAANGLTIQHLLGCVLI